MPRYAALRGIIGKQVLRDRYLAYCRNPDMMQLAVQPTARSLTPSCTNAAVPRGY